MHVGILAQESTTIASTLSLVFGGLLVYTFMIGFRGQYLLWLAVGFFGLSLYFGLLSISSGPQPVLSRGDIDRTVREVLIVSYLLLAVGFVRIARRLWRYSESCKHTPE